MKPAKKTLYSPAPMSEKAKKTASTRAAKKQVVTNVKKDLTKMAGNAKKAVGITLKAAALPSDMARKGAKAGLKALVKDPRATQRQVGRIEKVKPMPKKVYRQVGTTKPMPEKKKK
jgi:hypothetical protein